MVLNLLRWGSRTVIVITLGLLARDVFTSEDIETGWVVPLVIVLVAAQA